MTLLRVWSLFLVTAILLARAPQIDPGFEHFYNNEFDQALACFEQELSQHPDEPENYNHVAQVILYREMFRDGALESQLVTGNNPFLRRPKMEISAADKQQFTSAITKSLQLSQARFSHNRNDINALYALAVAHGLKSNYLFLVEKAWFDSLREATAARKAAETILRIDPHQVDAFLIIGLNRYVVGSLPFYMRALGFLGGFRGDRAEGIRDLEKVLQHGTRNRYDAEILLAVVYRREKLPAKALPLLESLVGEFPRNFLFRFEEIQMYSDAGKKDAALQVLDEIQKLRDENSPGYGALPQAKIDFTRGNLLFWYGDLDAALADLERASKDSSLLDLNAASLTWLRIGQISDLMVHRSEAVKAYKEVIDLAPGSDVAAEANGYLRTPFRRKNQKSQ